jgi:hypothetical protein
MTAWEEKQVDLSYFQIIHSNMHQRCENPKDPSYPYYGGRGVKVSKRWKHVATFIKDLLEDIGPRPGGVTSAGLSLYQLDRFPDREGDYRRGNVRWATIQQNQANKRPPRQKEVAPMFTNSSSHTTGLTVELRV